MAGPVLRRRLMRRPAIFAVAACTAVTIAGCSKSPDPEPETSSSTAAAGAVVITETDAGSTVSAAAGDTVELRLPSNPSTGYSWKVTTEPDAAVLKLGGMEHEAAETDAVGAGGTDVWTFTAEAAGSTEIALDYVGPGTDAEVGQSLSFAVDVTA